MKLKKNYLVGQYRILSKLKFSLYERSKNRIVSRHLKIHAMYFQIIILYSAIFSVLIYGYFYTIQNKTRPFGDNETAYSI